MPVGLERRLHNGRMPPERCLRPCCRHARCADIRPRRAAGDQRDPLKSGGRLPATGLAGVPRPLADVLSPLRRLGEGRHLLEAQLGAARPNGTPAGGPCALVHGRFELGCGCATWRYLCCSGDTSSSSGTDGPGRTSRCERETCRRHDIIEGWVGLLTRWRRLATRSEKLAVRYHTAVSLVLAATYAARHSSDATWHVTSAAASH